MTTSSSGSSTSSSPAASANPEDWARFLAGAKIIPLSLVTIHDLRKCFGLAKVKPIRPKTVNKRVRGALTFRQSQGFKTRGASMYERVSVGGQAIQDNGIQILKGAISIGVVKKILPFLDSALLVETNEGNDQYREKIEMRYRQTGPDQDGQMDVEWLQRSIESIPNETLVGTYLWVNPTDEGWLRLNLVLNKWDQEKVPALPKIDLEFLEVDGIPTFDLEALGFQF